MCERIFDRLGSGEGKSGVATVTPVVELGIELEWCGANRPAERLEQPPNGVAAMWRADHGRGHFEIESLVNQFGPLIALACHSGSVDLAYGNRKHRRSDIGPVVDVRLERGGRSSTATAAQADGVHFDQESCGGPLSLGFGVKDMRLTHLQVDAANAIRVFV